MHQRHKVSSPFSSVAHPIPRDKMHGHWNDCRRHPDMDVVSLTAGLVDIHAEQALAKSISTRQRHCGPKTQIDLREQYHDSYPFPSLAPCARSFPYLKTRALLLSLW